MHSFFPSLNQEMENSPDDNDDSLTLSLSCNPPKRARHSPSPQQNQIPTNPTMIVPYTASLPLIIDNDNNFDVHTNTLPPSQSRPQRAASQPAAPQKSNDIPQPFPWATNRRATIHSRKYLLENGIFTVTGSVQCKRCKTEFEMRFNLDNKFVELSKFIRRNKDDMHNRAPEEWLNPVLPTCEHCGRENSVQPLFPEKKKTFNWLFLFLGQMLGCCTLKQLKYFLKHNNIHRTGAKNRVLYSAYMAIHDQLWAT